LWSSSLLVTVLDVMAGAKTEKDLAQQWLDTGGIAIPGLGGTKSYPKRSELRRAEARASARRSAHSRPAGGRPSGAPAGRSRPPALTGAPRSRPTLSEQYSVPLAPTPAVLPIPQTDPWRPAGIDLPLSASTDAFHRPEPPAVPIAWGLDLTTPSPAQDEEPAPRRRFGRVSGTAGRLLIMALVVGAEGVAVAQFAGPTTPADGSATAALSRADVQEQAGQEREARIVEAKQEAAAKTAEVNQEVKEAAPAKAAAAADQYQEARADAARLEKARKARAARQAREAREAKAAREAREAAAAKAAASKAASKADQPKASTTTTKKTSSSGSNSGSSSSGSGATAPSNARKNPKAAARVLLADRGWSSAQFTCLDSLWTRESGWNYQATNPSSGAYGIPQALPGSKMGASGSDWKTNPVTQMRWGLDYIADRYGNPCGAWSHSESVGWY
jgi:hypothetical protein